MCAGDHRPVRPSLRAGWRNFADARMPVGRRLQLTAANLLRRRHGHGCCGNYGEPGC